MKYDMNDMIYFHDYIGETPMSTLYLIPEFTLPIWGDPEFSG